MQIRPFSPSPAPRFGMTPEQQKEMRDKIFEKLSPHLDDALQTTSNLMERRSQGSLNAYGITAQEVLRVLTKLATFQEAPKPPVL